MENLNQTKPPKMFRLVECAGDVRTSDRSISSWRTGRKVTVMGPTRSAKVTDPRHLLFTAHTGGRRFERRTIAPAPIARPDRYAMARAIAAGTPS